MSLDEKLRVIDVMVERGTMGHLLARLLGSFDETSPWLAAALRRAGSPEWIEAAERRLVVSRFVGGVLKRPVDTWRGELEAATEHHGPLLAIMLGNLAMRRLPGSPRAALELVAAARSCWGSVDPESWDLEIDLLLQSVEVVAQRVEAPDPRKAEVRSDPIVRELELIGVSIHPELVADTWGLCAVDRRIAGKLDLADSALRQALAWASGIGDDARVAEFELQRGLVQELRGRTAEACAADARAIQTLERFGGTLLLARAVLQRVGHLVDAERYDDAQWWLDQREELLRQVHGPAVVRLRGRIARGFGRFEDAAELLSTAQAMAEIDDDVVERALAGLERVALFDEMGHWTKRSRALAFLHEGLMECPQAPGDLVGAVARWTDEDFEEEPLAATVVPCLRRRLREWQARHCEAMDLRVM